jgi:hypothetical protein
MDQIDKLGHTPYLLAIAKINKNGLLLSDDYVSPEALKASLIVKAKGEPASSWESTSPSPVHVRADGIRLSVREAVSPQSFRARLLVLAHTYLVSLIA